MAPPTATKTTVEKAVSSPSVIGGTMIIAGTAVGVGMFSLPVAFSGMWFYWSLAALLVTWFFMFHAALMILEVNLNYPVGSSFSTMVKDTMGNRWNIVNSLSVAFVHYILIYAYISGGGSIVKHTFTAATGMDIPQKLAGFGFAFFTAFVVWCSTRAVDRIATIMLGGMLITFILSSAAMVGDIELVSLFNVAEDKVNYFPFIFAALPFCLPSFGFHANVPSLMKYYGKSPDKIIRCIRFGSLLVLTTYIIWITCNFGILPRIEFKAVVEQGGNIGVLIGALGGALEGDNIARLLNTFANLAVASSFLGVSLALFDFIADVFKFDDSAMGRFKTALVTFLPSTFGGLFFPDGFLYGIGFAGLGSAIYVTLVPPLMIRKCRERFGCKLYRVWGGNALAWAVILFGFFYGGCYILAMMDWLPVYK